MFHASSSKSQNSGWRRRVTVAGFLAGACLAASGALAATYQWQVTGSSGYWDTTGNWSPSSAYPNAVDDVADLRVDVAASQTVNLNDQTITLGTMKLGDTASGWDPQTIMNGSLVFQTSIGNARMETTNSGMINRITPSITLNSPLEIANLNTNGYSGRLRVSSVIANGTADTLILPSDNVGVVFFDDNSGENSFSYLVINGGNGWLNREVAGQNAAQNVTVNTGGTLTIGGVGGNQISNSGAIVLNGVMDTNGRSETIGTLAGDSNGYLYNSDGGAASTLTVGYESSGSSTYAGRITSDSAPGVGGTNVLNITKRGAGTLTLTNGANNYLGTTTVDQGTLAFASGALGSTGAIDFAGGTLQWYTGNTEDVSARMSPVDSTHQYILDTNGNNVTLATTLSGDGGLVKLGAGTLALTVSETYAGTTDVNGGTLAVNGSLASASVAVGTDGTLAGNGSISGPVAVSGSLSVGNAGDSSAQTLATGSLDLSASVNSFFDIFTATTADSVNVGGASLAYGGALSVAKAGSFTFQTGQSWDLFAFSGTPTGSFSSMNLPTLTGGMFWQFNEGTGILSITIPEPGVLIMFSSGLLGMMIYAWRKRK